MFIKKETNNYPEEIQKLINNKLQRPYVQGINGELLKFASRPFGGDNRYLQIDTNTYQAMIFQYETTLFEENLTKAMKGQLRSIFKRRLRVPLTSTRPEVFTAYFDHYERICHKRMKMMKPIRPASKERTMHIQYRFEAPFLPPLAQERWFMREESCLISDSEDLIAQQIEFAKVEEDYDDLIFLDAMQREEIDINEDMSSTLHICEFVDIITFIRYVTFTIDTNTNLVSASLYLNTLKLAADKEWVHC